MKSFYKKLSTSALDVLFPIWCADCGQEGEWWCSSCQTKISAQGVRFCPECALPTGRGEPCPEHSYSPLTGAVAVAEYTENSPLARLIHNFKYGFAKETLPLFAGLWQKYLSEHDLPLAQAIIPVPLHPRRFRERGFNQAELLAGALVAVANGLGKSVPPIITSGLERIVYTSQQARLNRNQRLQNMEGAFTWQAKTSAPRRVILLDDIFTTGATAKAAARVLRAHGSYEVFVLTMARSLK